MPDGTFGSLAAAQDPVNKTALGRFGSGRGWPGVGADGKLAVGTENFARLTGSVARKAKKIRPRQNDCRGR